MGSQVLVVLAAGAGRRFGGNKQLSAVGPAGEVLMDYTVARAGQVGFRRVVVVTRAELATAMGEHFSRFAALPVELVHQARGTAGTVPAVMAARRLVGGEGTFAVVNADDLYPLDAMQALQRWSGPGHAVVGFRLDRTTQLWSATVNRALCRVDRGGRLTGLEEVAVTAHDGQLWTGDPAGSAGPRPAAAPEPTVAEPAVAEPAVTEPAAPEPGEAGGRVVAGGRRVVAGEGPVGAGEGPVGAGEGVAGGRRVVAGEGPVAGGRRVVAGEGPVGVGGRRVAGDQLVSMNAWAFGPSIWHELAAAAETGASESAASKPGEILIPVVMGSLVARHAAKVTVLPVDGSCVGITWPDELATVRAHVAHLLAEGQLPTQIGGQQRP